MGAPIGNKNAIGNEGGRPPYFDESNDSDIETVNKLCLEYFESIKELEPPTVTGLALFLGFDAKSTLYEYAKNIMFSNPIKRALMKIEKYHEIQTAGGDKCTGNIFILKNFGWKDTINQEHSGEIKGTSPTIVFLDDPQSDD